MRRRIAELVAIAAATVSSAATGQSKIAPPPPPYIGAYQPKGVDVIGLWRQEDEDDRALANSPILIRDEALKSSVKNVLCEALGTASCGRSDESRGGDECVRSGSYRRSTYHSIKKKNNF